MRRVLMLTVVLVALCPATAMAASRGFVVAKSGGYPGIAVDRAGNLLVAYKVDTYGASDAVELCVVPPRKRACAVRTRIAFPGQGYNINAVGVHEASDGTIAVVTGRADPFGGSVYLATSSDGGHSFRTGFAIADGSSGPSVLMPDGRFGLISGSVPGMTVGTPHSTGADARRERPELDDFGLYTSITNFNGGLVAASSAAGSSRAWFMPPGADGFLSSSWLELPALLSGRQPQVAGGRAGVGVLLEGDNTGLHFRRLGKKRWSRPLFLGAPSYDTGFDLVQDARGRLFASWAVVPVNDSRTRVEAVMSTDRGATWSSVSRLARTSEDVFGDDFYMGLGKGGRGGIVFFDDAPGGGAGNLGPVRVVRISPSRIPTAGKRVGKGHVSLRVSADVSCVKERNATTRLQASLRGKRVRVGRFVRSVSFSANARRRGGLPFGARWLLNHGGTRVGAHVVPRNGRPFTLRLPMRGCL